MSILDLFRMVLGNLNRRKARVALTTLGVMIGSASVVVLVSLGAGMSRATQQQFESMSDLTRILVTPQQDVLSSQSGVTAGDPARAEVKQLTNADLAALRAIPQVLAAFPEHFVFAPATMSWRQLEGGGMIVGVPDGYMQALGYATREGNPGLKHGTAVIGCNLAETLRPRTMHPGSQPMQPPDLMDETIKITIQKETPDSEMATKTIRVRVTGILAQESSSDYNLYLPIEDAIAISEWYAGTRARSAEPSYRRLVVKVDDLAHVADVVDSIEAMDLRADAAMSTVERVNALYIMIQLLLAGVGTITLIVAAIGIANTMTMAIMERTREIGLLKALGATNIDVLAIFLGEATCIGLFGGIGGNALGAIVVKAINGYGAQILSEFMSSRPGTALTLALFSPPWLYLFCALFAMLIGLFSGFYPSLRAANMTPIAALKYE